MHNIKHKILFCLAAFFVIFNTNAQCAMCRAVLESQDSQATAKGINDGIVYLMVIPYLLAAALGIIIYLKFFKSKRST